MYGLSVETSWRHLQIKTQKHFRMIRKKCKNMKNIYDGEEFILFWIPDSFVRGANPINCQIFQQTP